MKIQSILLLASSAFSMSSFGQNLVPNPDFEVRDADFCGISGPTDLTNSLSEWSSPTSGTPDVFFTDIASACWNFQPLSTYPGPIGLKGEQLPRSGASMAGMGLYTIAGMNQREYIQVHLNSPVVNGGKYLVECFVSLGDFTEFASNGLGFALSVNPISSGNNEVLSATPQYVVPNPISETQQWVRIFDTITVTDAFEYLTIGNFGDDASTTVLANPSASGQPGTYGAYYFIDDVRVERVFTDPASGVDEIRALNIRVFPNPTTDELQIELPENESTAKIELIDVHGRVVLSVDGNFKTRTLDLTNLQNGVYFVQIECELGTYSERIVKK